MVSERVSEGTEMQVPEQSCHNNAFFCGFGTGNTLKMNCLRPCVFSEFQAEGISMHFFDGFALERLRKQHCYCGIALASILLILS